MSSFFSLLDQAYPWYNKVMRLDKLLGQAGYGSRNQVKKLIRSRQVYVDGVLADRDNLNVDASLQTLKIRETVFILWADWIETRRVWC